MDYLDDLANHMQANGLGTVGVDIFKYGLTDAPPTQYALIPTGGVPPDRTMDNTEYTFQPTMQVLSRAGENQSQLAATRAMSAYELFKAIAEQQIGTAHYQIVDPIQAPFVLEYQRTDSGQYAPIFAFNVQIEVVQP